MKITFRKERKPTGLGAIGSPYPSTRIKVDTKECGYITPPNWNSPDNLWRVGISIIKKNLDEDGNPNCGWRWFRPVESFENEPSARIFVKEKLIPYLVNNEHRLYFFEE